MPKNRREQQTATLRDQLERWRAHDGGRGKRLPEPIWAEAVALAREQGVGRTARALALDPRRLAGRAELAKADTAGPPRKLSAEQTEGFVQLDPSVLWSGSRTTVRLEGRGGERMQVELGAGASLDVVALAQAFWGRR